MGLVGVAVFPHTHTPETSSEPEGAGARFSPPLLSPQVLRATSAGYFSDITMGILYNQEIFSHL